MRQAAVAAGPAQVDSREFLRSETNSAVRLGAVVRLTKAEGEGSIPDLISLLRAGDWQARSVAADCVVMLGSAGADAVRPLIHDADLNVRTCAARILLDLHQEDWLRGELGL